MKNRIYVLLDKNLSNQQKVVQAAHLSLEVSMKKGVPETHPSIIVLAIEKQDLEKIRSYLEKKSLEFVDFYEPLFESITGLATVPLSSEQGKLLQHFPTLKKKDFQGECV